MKLVFPSFCLVLCFSGSVSFFKNGIMFRPFVLHPEKLQTEGICSFCQSIVCMNLIVLFSFKFILECTFKPRFKNEKIRGKVAGDFSNSSDSG